MKYNEISSVGRPRLDRDEYQVIMLNPIATTSLSANNCHCLTEVHYIISPDPITNYTDCLKFLSLLKISFILPTTIKLYK